MARFVFGDIHGQYDALMQLIDFIQCDAADQLFFLGDLIDRGNRSAEVVRWVMANRHTCLKGNHEQMCVDAFDNGEDSVMWQAWLQSGGIKTLESYGSKELPQKHIEWMRKLPLYADLDDVWLVHAGLNPKLPIELQGAAEFCWIREEFHNMTEPFFPNKTIISGHTITFIFHGVEPGNLVIGQGWIGLETGAYHPKSGWLSALNLDTATVYQCNTFSKELRAKSLVDIATVITPRKLSLVQTSNNQANDSKINRLKKMWFRS